MENAANITSEEELLELKNEGKITEDEYQDLLSAIRKTPAQKIPGAVNIEKSFSLHEVPWQIWVVVALLSIEGIGNLFSIPNQPMSATWLAAKIIFILGLLKGWRWVFCLSLIIGGIHVLYFLIPAPLVALINFVLVVLTLSAYRFYFPKTEINRNPEISGTFSHTSNQSMFHKKLGKGAFILMLSGVVLPFLFIGFCKGYNWVAITICDYFSEESPNLDFRIYTISHKAVGPILWMALFIIEGTSLYMGIIAWRDALGKAAIIGSIILLAFTLLI